MTMELEPYSHVALTYQDFSNEKGQRSSHAIVFFPGWAMRGDSQALVPIGRQMHQKQPDKRIITVSTRPLTLDVSSTDETTRIIEFLNRQGVDHVTLVGYSEGARRAISVAAALQNGEDIHVDKVVLASPLGVSPTPRLAGRLMKAMFLNIPANTLAHIARHPQDARAFFYGLRAAGGIATGTAQEVNVHPVRYLRRLGRELHEMKRVHPQMNQMQSPVRLVLGRRDTVVKLKEVEKAVGTSGIPTIIIDTLSSHGLPFVNPKEFVQRALDNQS